jgi:hypothetical protein
MGHHSVTHSQRKNRCYSEKARASKTSFGLKCDPSPRGCRASWKVHGVGLKQAMEYTAIAVPTCQVSKTLHFFEGPRQR